MATENWQTFCPSCQKLTMGSRQTPNHLLHFIVTFFTCGLWVIPWVIITVTTSSAPYLCNICGTPGRNS